MPEEIGTSDNKKNLPAITGINYQDTIADDLPAMAAGLVHEIKNPLAAIHLHLQLLENHIREVEDEALREKMGDRVSIIKKQILGINQILQDFFRLIRPQQTEKEIAVDINAIISEIISFLEPQALREGIDLQYNPGTIEKIFNSDSSFIKQVAINLILNAIQAFQKSEIPMEDRKIIVSTGSSGASIFFRVDDNGPGIPQEKLDQIFEPFFSTKKEGSGLGLALVKKMITELGGRVDVKSIPGKGTSFNVILGSVPELDHKETID